MRAAEDQDRAPRSEPRWLRLLPASLLGLGALLRLLQLLELPSFPSFFAPEVDAYYYQLYARRIAHGDWLLSGTPPRMSPGYTWFLAVLYRLFGSGPWVAPVVQMLLGLCGVWLIYRVALRYAGPRWALLALGLAALYGPFIYFESHLLAAALGVLLVAWLLWLASGLYFGTPATAARLLAIGAVWGLCSVARPNALLLFVALSWLAWSVGERSAAQALRRLGWLALGGALAIAPLTLRNLVVTGEPVLITSHGGINFYIGNGPGAKGTWTVPKDVPGADSPTSQFDAFQRVAEERSGRALSGREADAYWYRRTLQAVEHDPVRWFGVLGRKFHLFWNGRELHNIYDYEFWRDIGVVLGLPLPQFSWIAPLGLLAMFWLSVRSAAERFLAVFIACLCAALVLVYVTDRYRVPVAVPVLVATPVVVRELAARLRAWLRAPAGRRPAAALAWPLVGLALGIALAVPVQVNKRYHEKYTRLGDAWVRLGQLAPAQWAYEHALAANPRYLPAQQALADVYARSGQLDKARAHFRRAAELARVRGDQTALERAEQSLRALESSRQALQASP